MLFHTLGCGKMPFCRKVCVSNKCKINARSRITKITAGNTDTKITTVTTRYWNKKLNEYEKVTGMNNADFFARQIDQQLSIPYLHIDSTETQQRVHKNMFESDENRAYPIFTIDQQKAQNILKNDFKWKDDKSDVIVFVHGFNTSIEGAQTAARLIRESMDMTNTNKSIHVIAYDWASTYGSGFWDLITNLFNRSLLAKVIPSIAKNYAQDSEAAQTSVRPLVWLLYVLLAANSTCKIHIISHSMGTRIVSAAIKNIVINHDMLKGIKCTHYKDDDNDIMLKVTQVEDHEKIISKIKLLIFKQADMDIANMAETLATIERVRILINKKDVCMPIIFAHTKDQPLNASKEIHAGLDRVGLFDANKVKDIVKAANENGVNNLVKVEKYLLGTATNWSEWNPWLEDLQVNACTNISKEQQTQLFTVLKSIGDTSKWKIWLNNLINSDELKKWTTKLNPTDAATLKNWLNDVKTYTLKKSSGNTGHRIGVLKNARVFLSKNNKDKSNHSYFDNGNFQSVISEFVRCYDTYVVSNEYPEPDNLFEVLRSLICIYQQYKQPEAEPLPEKPLLLQARDIFVIKEKLNVSPTPAEFRELVSPKATPDGKISKAEVYAIINASLMHD